MLRGKRCEVAARDRSARLTVFEDRLDRLTNDVS
jgi:hypothetical protein